MKFKTLTPKSWRSARLAQLLTAVKGKRVLVVGDVGLDRYTIGTVERISPEAPVPIVLVRDEQFKLGLAANVADNVNVLGGEALLVGVIGRDRAGVDFKKMLKHSGVGTDHLVVDPSRRTVLKERIVSDRQQLLRVDYESTEPVDEIVRKRVLKTIAAALKTADAVVFEDYAKGLASQAFSQKLFSLARKAKKPVAVDPNTRTPIAYYKGAFVLTPNTMEAEFLAEIRIRDLESLALAGSRILQATQAQHVVITRGRDGMAIFTRGSKEAQLIETYAREVFDVSGAGDTVIAVLTLALCAGATIEEACVLGNLAAGVEVGKRGTATVTPDEITEALHFFMTPKL
jgi:rfaE bifunctional protein kinase chain/domain